MGAFIGRARELEALVRVVDRAAAGGGAAAVVVVGDAGIGKTRLLAEALDRASLPRAFHAAGYEPEAPVPLAAAAELLKALVQLGAAGRRLGELFFEAPTSDPSGLERVRIFEATHRALRTVGPSLVVVDDLQWVDELSLALFHFLVRAILREGRGLLGIAEERPRAGERSPARAVAVVDR